MTDERFVPLHRRESTKTNAADNERSHKVYHAAGGGGKRPYVRPVIQTFCPPSTGLPSGVITEWSGASLRDVGPGEPDPNQERHQERATVSTATIRGAFRKGLAVFARPSWNDCT